MSVPLPKGFKPPLGMDMYDRTTDAQEHLDAFRVRPNKVLTIKLFGGHCDKRHSSGLLP